MIQRVYESLCLDMELRTCRIKQVEIRKGTYVSLYFIPKLGATLASLIFDNPSIIVINFYVPVVMMPSCKLFFI